MITRVGFTVSLTSLAVVAGGGCKVDDGDTGEAADTSTESTETGGEPIDCGESECAADQACLTFFTPPMCMNKFEDEPCPDGTTEALCGGAGIPCCCGPTPAPVYECVATSACGELVDCACLADVCVPTARRPPPRGCSTVRSPRLPESACVRAVWQLEMRPL